MRMSIRQVAELLKGDIIGSEAGYFNKVAPLHEADQSALSFLANSKYEKYIDTTHAAVVLVNNEFRPQKGVTYPTLIRVEDPYTSFAVVLEQFERASSVKRVGIEAPVYQADEITIGENVYVGAFSYLSRCVTIGDNVKIYPQSYIGDNVQIGDGTVVFPGVKIYPNVVIGKYCTIEAGAVIGSEGFGFAPQTDGNLKRVPQIGNVVLGDHVSIGANTTIDRATVGTTVIEAGVKLDNLVHIGHNVHIGKDSAIAAQAGIAGSTTIGRNCLLGGQVGIVGHLEIANKTQLAPKSGVMSSIREEGRVLLGAPAMDFAHTKKVWVIWKKLPELQRRLELLERPDKVN